MFYNQNIVSLESNWFSVQFR